MNYRFTQSKAFAARVAKFTCNLCGCSSPAKAARVVTGVLSDAQFIASVAARQETQLPTHVAGRVAASSQRLRGAAQLLGARVLIDTGDPLRPVLYQFDESHVLAVPVPYERKDR